MKKRLVSLVLVATMVLSMTACGKKSENAASTTGTATASSDAHYTYNVTNSNPKTWSATDWENNNESLVLGYTTSFLYDFVMNETKDGYDIVPEMAAEMPVDVTSEYVGKYNVPEDATEGYAWKIALNKDACWEDGTPITAHDYEYTLQQFLNPEMKNYRASSFFTGSNAIANAQGYYGGGEMPVFNAEEGAYVDVADADMFVSVSDNVPFFGDGSLEGYYESYADNYKDADGNDLFEVLKAACGDGKAALTDELKAALTTIAANFGDARDEAYKEFCTYNDPDAACSWDEVGFIVNDDYTITFVWSSPNKFFDLCYGLTAVYLVKEDLYEANKVQTGAIVKSKYGTSVDTYASYGPYKIESFQQDKEMKFTKNENWYGWTDGKHEGQYMTTDIVVSYITEHTTELSLFLQGKLDAVGLTSEDMDTYGSSDFIYFTPESYTYKYTFNSDIEQLKKEETPGINRSILSYDDFRHAISVAVDRNDYVNSCTAAHQAGFGLLNYIYVCDPDTGALYRDSKPAQDALCDVYGVSDIKDITGYDPELAKELFQKAYEQAIADGNMSETDKVEFDMHVYGSDSTYQKLVDFLQSAITNATVGTGLEGKVTLNLVEDQDYYTNLKNGIVDIALTAWGGADMDPYSIVECYFNDNYKNEYGFQPTKETCVINVNGQDVEKTYYDWYEALCLGEYKAADLDTKNLILANLEKNFLLQYECTPMSYRTASSLLSQRTVPGTDTFINSLVEFGGIRFQTYTMDDAEWEAYCAEQNNQLTY